MLSFVLTPEESLSCMAPATVARNIKLGAKFEFIGGQNKLFGRKRGQDVFLPKIKELLATENLMIGDPFRPNSTKKESRIMKGFILCKVHKKKKNACKVWTDLESFEPGKQIKFQLEDWKCKDCHPEAEDHIDGRGDEEEVLELQIINQVVQPIIIYHSAKENEDGSLIIMKSDSCLGKLQMAIAKLLIEKVFTIHQASWPEKLDLYPNFAVDLTNSIISLADEAIVDLVAEDPVNANTTNSASENSQ